MIAGVGLALHSVHPPADAQAGPEPTLSAPDAPSPSPSPPPMPDAPHPNAPPSADPLVKIDLPVFKKEKDHGHDGHHD